jgi:Bacterial protein of unknown function (DUF916)
MRRRHRKWTPAWILLVVVLLVCTGPNAWAVPSSSPSSAANPNAASATFGLGPASATKVDGRPNFEYFAGPGSQASDHVAVLNLSAFAITLHVYATDALNDATGAIGYQPASAPKTGAAAWLQIATPRGSGQITLAARTTVILPIKLEVPPGASPGDHTAGIAVGLLTSVASKNAKKITLEQRVVAKAFIRVSGPLHPALSIAALGATYRGTLNPFGKGSISVHYVVKNTGNVNLSGKQKVSIGGLFGSSSTVSTIASVPLLLPGGSMPVTVKVGDAWPQVLVKGRASVTPLSAPGAVNPPLRQASASVTFWAMPWTLIAIIIVIGLLLAGWIWRRRRVTPLGPPPPGQLVGEPLPVG